MPLRGALFPKGHEAIGLRFSAALSGNVAKAQMSAIPVPDPRIERGKTLQLLQVDLPSPINQPTGCVFRTRCRQGGGAMCPGHSALAERGGPNPKRLHSGLKPSFTRTTPKVLLLIQLPV